MAIRIDWEPASEALHEIYADLTDYHDDWPRPNLDDRAVSEQERLSAGRRWCQRVRASYVTMAKASALHADLVALGAPIDILTGASYTTDELGHHLAGLIDLARCFEPETELTVPDEMIAMATRPPSWEKAFERALDLFACNLAVSQPVYEALTVSVSDPSIRERCQELFESLEELLYFGRMTLQWMGSTLPRQKMEPARARLPRLLGAYESLCGGSPELLDALAGSELTIEARHSNLGTLDSEQLAVIFYDTLTSAIFPALRQMEIDGNEVWQRRVRSTSEARIPPATIAGVGLRI